MKTSNYALIASLLATAPLAIADTTPAPAPSPAPTPACQILRTAKAKVYVSKLSYTQVNGTWTWNNQLICSTNNADVPVASASGPGCSYNQIFTCDALLDGVMHTVTVSGLIYFYTPVTPTVNNPAIKEFAVSYNIDRNNGETGFTASTTQNLNQSEAGMNFDTSRSKTTSGTAYNDSLNLNVTFEDANAAQ